jgi:hypothetical protein
MAFLAIIGLIAILWFLSKGLKLLGNFLTNLGDEMISYSISVKKTKWDNKETENNVSELKNKLDVVKENSDRSFKSKIQKEIEDLTGGQK